MDWKGFAWKFIAFILIVGFIIQFFPLSNNNQQSSQPALNSSNFSGTVSLNASINFFDGNVYVFCNSTLQDNVSNVLMNSFDNKSILQGSVPQLGLEFLVQSSNYSTVVNKVRFALKDYCNPLVFREAGVQVLDQKTPVNTTSGGLFYLTDYQFGSYAVSNGVVGSLNNLTLFGVPAMIGDSSAGLNDNVSLQGQVSFANNSIQNVRLVQLNFNPSLAVFKGEVNSTIAGFTGFNAVLSIPWSQRNSNFSLFNSTPSINLNNSVIIKGNVSSVLAVNRSFDGNYTVLEFPSNFTNQSVLNFSNAFFPDSAFTFNFNSSDSFENVSKQIQKIGYNFTLYRRAVFTFNQTSFLEKFGFYNNSFLTGLTGNLNMGDNLTLNVSGLTEDGVVVSVNAVQSNPTP
jgi:hypothetical protein